MPVAVRTEAPAGLCLPTQDELQYSDGEPMENDFHVLQMFLLIETLEMAWAGRDCFAGGNMFLHFRVDDALRGVRNRFRGPDVLVAVGVPNRSQRPRKSWVVWEEGKPPDVVIEVLSASTAAEDLGEKKRVYQDEVRVPEYYCFDPESLEIFGFRLADRRYEPIAPDAAGRYPSRGLGLMLGVWEGEYYRWPSHWLRWFTTEGELLPTGAEDARATTMRLRAEAGRARKAEAERERAEAERERLAARLRALGVDPDQI